jgi:hypothetical protein
MSKPNKTISKIRDAIWLLGAYESIVENLF